MPHPSFRLLVANAGNPLNWELLGAGLALAGLIILGALTIYWVGRWLKQPPPPPIRPEQQLSQYRTLYDSGEITKEEFDSIRIQLEKKASLPPPSPPDPK